MSAPSTPAAGPSIVQVELRGEPGAVDQFVALLNSHAELISDIPTGTDPRGETSRSVQLVLHDTPRPITPGQGASVTLQCVLDAEGGAFSRLPDHEAAAEVQADVEQALQQVPGVRQAQGHIVSAWGLPAPTR
ncbi:hypothetical protein [Streptomyces sp. NBC_00470]|uniref:hypothetical protein n=1 Tax=Streptomyces sp. NBC_00470 TaxID=2975753 RepID=UPI002F918CB8